MRLITIQKTRWAMGLQWFTPSGKFNVKNSAERLELDVKKTVLAQCPQPPRQYAFGDADTNWKHGHSLAAVLRVSTYSLLGIFHFESDGEEFWWVYAVRQGIISAQGDRICNSAEEAHAHGLLLRDLLGDFEETANCETDAESRAWLLPFLPSIPFFKARLSLVHGGERHKQSMLLAVIGIAVCAGLYLLNSALEQRASHKAMEAVRLALLDKAKRQQGLLSEPEKQFSQPWQTSHDNLEMLASCLDGMFRLPTTVNGWVLDEAICDGATITSQWAHSSAASFEHLPLGGRLKNPLLVTAYTKLAQSRSHPLQSLSYQSLPTKEAISKVVYQSAQTLGLRASIRFTPAQKKTVEKIEIVAPWLSAEWELSGLPAMLLLDLDTGLGTPLLHNPGFCLQTVTMKKDLWTLRGSLYALP